MNDLESVSSPTLQNQLDEKSDVMTQASADTEPIDKLHAIRSKQNSIVDSNQIGKRWCILWT